MSYILDALKKSDEKRNALNLPEEAPVCARLQESGAQRFALPLALLLGGLIMGGWLITQLQKTEHETPQTALVNPASRPTAVPTTRTENPIDTVAVATTARQTVQDSPQAEQADAPVKHPDMNEAANSAEEEIIPLFSPHTATLNREHPRPVIDEEQPLSADANIPSRSELPARLQQSLPVINIEGHIYDDKPQSRMLIINGMMRREKQSIGSGLQLEEITPDGAILSYQGTAFHMGIFGQ